MSMYKNIIIIFCISLIVRLLFSFYFQIYYFGDLTFEYADSPQYLLPIINLINNGEYIIDAFLTDSKYFRPPVYPLILGFFYLVSLLYFVLLLLKGKR